MLSQSFTVNILLCLNGHFKNAYTLRARLLTVSLKLFFILGKDAKRSILLKSEECQTEIEYAFYRENVAKKYAKFFQSTLHHNNGYFLQVCLVFMSVFI